MIKEFAVIHNSLLENFYFNNEAKPESKELNLRALTEAMHHLLFVTQCIEDSAVGLLLAASCTELQAGRIPGVFPIEQWMGAA